MSKSWGTPTWYFFHSFAQHINDDFYKKNKDIICSLLKAICFNLPCDECSKHAKQYTRNTLNGKYIKNKKDLQDYFYSFHNSVNVRKGKKKFTNYDMYKKSKLFQISNNFFVIYSGTHNPHRGFTDQLNRTHIVKEFKNLFKNNSNKFTWMV